MEKQIVKVTLFPADANMDRYISKQFFQEFHFEINNPECVECDFWIVFGYMPYKSEKVKVNPKNIFLITYEFDGGYNQKFLNQFQKVITVDTRLKGNNLVYNHVGIPWFINDNFDNLYHTKHIEKTKLLSIVVSSKATITYARNYKIRYDFVMALNQHFRDRIDIFGRGFKEITHKDEGLRPYKYSVAIENMPLPFWMSEKLHDCFLTHTYPLYYDCPNVNRFFDSRSYQKLDIMDHQYSINLIEELINSPIHYEEHLSFLIEAKKKYLTDYSFESVLVNTVLKHGELGLEKKEVIIYADNELRSKVKLKLIDLVYKFLK